MASTYKTPGVYVEEIALFPPSVAQVETAVPAFIGYTEKAEKGGQDLHDVPTKITSFLEFELYFGAAYLYQDGDIKVVADESNNYAVKSVTYTNKVFYLYEAVRLYFDNGGGKCYIVSVDTFQNAPFTSGNLSNATGLKRGLTAIEKYDEPTLILFPDAVNLADASQFYALQQAALAQCNKLQDRFSVFDMKENATNWNDAIQSFRDNIGINNLKYGAAYTPWLYNAYAKNIDFNLFKNNVRNSTDTATLDLENLTSDAKLNSLVTSLNVANEDVNKISASINSLKTSAFGTIQSRYNKLKSEVITAAPANTKAAFNSLIGFIREAAQEFPKWRNETSLTKLEGERLVKDLDTYASNPDNGLRKYIVDLIKFEKHANIDAVVSSTLNYGPVYDGVPVAAPDSWLGTNAGVITASTADYGAAPTNAATTRATILAAMADLDAIFKGLDEFIQKIITTANKYKSVSQELLYAAHSGIGSMVAAIKKHLSVVPPSGAICGVYAKVDSERGVWKAPANISLSSVIGPVRIIDNTTQDDLNVDVNAGKSINAIRAFTGKGTLVWGARTLAGNDNEWRYVSVRRFYNMVEESVMKASGQFVFEPNDANTWVKVKGMIENYLTNLWRQGALAGAKAEHAFFVKIGLGETMTAVDILEGRMNVEIGMAVVRPAEFIILKFSHKMQES